MNSIAQRRGVRQFVKFGIVGAISTVIDWGIFYFLNWFGLYYLAAKVISFMFAVSNSYMLNRQWTFRSHGPKFQEGIKFVFVSSAGLVMNAYIMLLAVESFNWRKIYALMAASAIVMFWNFLANKFWTFRQQ